MKDNLGDFWLSIGDEITSQLEKVENLIGYNHLLTSGEFLEEILRNVIRQYIPQQYTVGSGFIIDSNSGSKRCSYQIDILIFDNTYPIIYSYNDVYFVPQQAVVGMIEVKKTLTTDVLKESLFKMNYNACLLKENKKVTKTKLLLEEMKKIDDDEPLTVFDAPTSDEVFEGSPRINKKIDFLLARIEPKSRTPFIGIYAFYSKLSKNTVKKILEHTPFPKHPFYVNFLKIPAVDKQTYMFIRTEPNDYQGIYLYPKTGKNNTDSFFLTNLIFCLNGRKSVMRSYFQTKKQ